MRKLQPSYPRSGFSSVALWPMVVLLLVAPTAWAAELSHPLAGAPGEVVAGASAFSEHSRRPIALPPTHIRPIGISVPAVVNPTALYHSEPAPMGIGDFGVGAGGRAYTYGTTEFLGNFSWQNLSIRNGSDTQFTDQLNVVLQFKQSGVTYAYWIQDVAFMDSNTGELTYENNIWNFTTGSYCLSNSALSGNGTVYPISGCEGYYAVSATTQPGADVFMPSPGDFSVMVRSYTSGTGQPEVAFEYWDGLTSYEVTYDNVLWPWATAVTLDNNFYVDGNNTAPSGNFYDAELSLGGPGGGSKTTAQNLQDSNSRLLYWNGHNLEATRSVWNFGSDTAEAISNVQSFFSHDSGGTPLTTQLNGTLRNATPARAYDQGRVGILAISAPSISSGTVSVAGTPWDFLTGQASLTLVPGYFHVWVNGSTHYDLGTCEIIGGKTTSVSVPGSCFPSVSTPVGTPPSADVGQSVSFLATLTGSGSGGDTYNWGSLPAGLGCAASVTNSLSCVPVSPGTYSVQTNVTDSASQTNASGILLYTVYSDPVVGTPTAAPPTAEAGAAVTFSASPSGGSGGYTFAWTHLPAPCSAVLTASPLCHPASSGVYAVSVNVTDSNGFKVASSVLHYTVAAGPLISVPVATPIGPIDIGRSVNFSTTASGGLAPYTYSWANLPTGCVTSNVSLLSCTPTRGGTFLVTVSVTDAAHGANTSGQESFTVNSPLVVGSVSPTPLSIDLGQDVTFAAIGVSGGDGVYSFVWSGLPTGCGSVDAASVPCSPTAVGTFSPNVTLSDSAGSRATSEAMFTVFSAPSVTGIATSRAQGDIGQVVNFSAEGVAGGTGGYSYVWTNLPTGCPTENAVSVSCYPVTAGTFPVEVIVTDSNNGAGHYTTDYVVDTLPTPGAPMSSPTPGLVGQSVVLIVAVVGGSGNLRFTWNGLPPGCSSSNSSKVTCTPSSAGTYQVSVTVVDSNGASATGPAESLVVDATVLGFPPTEGYLLFGAIIVLVAAVVLGVVWARRRRTKTPPTPSK